MTIQPDMQVPKNYDARLHTRSGVHSIKLLTAYGLWERFRGLMFSAQLPKGLGFLIPKCSSVHCFFMRYPIDVVYIDGDGRVLKYVRGMAPWKISAVAPWLRSKASAVHTLELAAGSIDKFAIDYGSRLIYVPPKSRHTMGTLPKHQAWHRGSAMTEFVVVGPVITLLGLAILQYGLLFFAKNQLNHATFMAARAGSVGNASLEKIETAFANALVPLYGGGQSAAEIAASLAKAKADLAGNVRIELLNPTKESFDDWSDPDLQKALKTGSRRVIRNSNLPFLSPGMTEIKPNSGQTRQDANLIKLRITHGYMPKVPVVSNIYKVYLKWLDPKSDSFHTQLVEAGRIPVVTHVTMQMQSHPIESDNPVSLPGAGNGGQTTDPGDPPVSNTPPPECGTLSCHPSQPKPSPPVDPDGPCTGNDCPVCEVPSA
ncbi:DUF192 domain-containing protein [Massilia sp. UMI-21]|nr:DUF192 domain-containing protein [Massilia sp. UMI-21]